MNILRNTLLVTFLAMIMHTAEAQRATTRFRPQNDSVVAVQPQVVEEPNPNKKYTLINKQGNSKPKTVRRTTVPTEALPTEQQPSPKDEPKSKDK